MAPLPGAIEAMPTCTDGVFSGRSSLTALTMSACFFLSTVETMRRPPRSMSDWGILYLLTTSFLTISVR